MKNSSNATLMKWMILTGLTYLFYMTLLRFIFFYTFKPSGVNLIDNLPVFTHGFKFDLQIVCAILLPPMLLGLVNLKRSNGRFTRNTLMQIAAILSLMAIVIYFILKGERMSMERLYFLIFLFIILIVTLLFIKDCRPFTNPISTKMYKIYFLCVTIFIAILYVLDFPHFHYLQYRLNASTLAFTDDLEISLGMIWQSFPVITLFIFILVSIVTLNWIILFWYRKIKDVSGKNVSKIQFLFNGAFIFTLLIGLFGSTKLYPLKFDKILKWSDAYIFQDNFKGNLALNPVQSFINTIDVVNTSYNVAKAKEYYSLIVSHLNIQDSNSSNLNYSRNITGHSSISPSPNIVLILCESFAGYKTSMWGNPLDATPFFNDLSKEGIFFDRCFTPGYGTTRGVWATLTGIPDVEYPYTNTASKNPALGDQHTIINEFQDYEKMYFIGGSSKFENINSLFTNNIKNIRIYEEEDFKSKRVSVWGITDKNLFLEANDILKKETKPFFAIIQTSGNHMPYAFAKEDEVEFKQLKYPEDTVKKYGLYNNDELNAFRYTDFAIRKFIEAAKTENYFQNTLFVFVGDHGVPGENFGNFPDVWSSDWLSYNHVPLLFYAPGKLSPMRIRKTVSQLDILPSISSLVNINVRNTTFGKNLFDTTQNHSDLNNARFIYNPLENALSIISDDYIYTFNKNKNIESLRSSKDNSILDQTPDYFKNKKNMKSLAFAYYETAKYMLYHNKKLPPQ